MQVYQSKYLTILFDESDKLLTVNWSSHTSNMQDTEFREEMVHYAEVAEKYQPAKSLVNTQSFMMTVAPETQEWVNQHIHPRSVRAGISKFAYLMSADIFSQISIEQTMEEGNAKELFDTKFFGQEKDALDWLSAR